MATDTVTLPEVEKGIETHGIERVSPQTRTHVRIFDNFTMWLSANLVISTVGTGAIAIPFLQLGFWDSFAVIVIFNVLGASPTNSSSSFQYLGSAQNWSQATVAHFCKEAFLGKSTFGILIIDIFPLNY